MAGDKLGNRGGRACVGLISFRVGERDCDCRRQSPPTGPASKYWLGRHGLAAWHLAVVDAPWFEQAVRRTNMA
jgi:hypothetical protein